MIKPDLWQAEIGPRWRITIDYDDTITPELLVRLCKEGMKRWGIWRGWIRWWLKGHRFKLELALDMRDAIERPVEVLEAVASSMVRSAAKMGILEQLPKAFFGGQVPRLNAEGLPIPYEDSPILGLDGKPMPKATD